MMLKLALPLVQKARIARDPRFDGLFFIGVRTTGIFCRPICKARMPLEKNVTYYDNAITAMNAGFRPCLMCRPDSAPGSCAWKGVETTVERGVTLLSAHLSLSIAEIADKLGISTRYFTKLFEQHLQISPKRYQLLSRLLFAKQLLHESGLPIEQVAQACGFNAAKPLQHHMKLNTGLTPSQIRRSNSVKADTEASEVKVHLAYRPPYQWQHIHDFFKLREIQSNEKIESDSIRKVMRLGDNSIFFHAVHQPDKNRFEATFWLSDLRLLKACIAALKKMLDLNCQPDAIYDALKEAGLPPNAILNGLRLPGITDRFEAGCRAIVGQQVSVKAAIGQLNLLQNTLNNKKIKGSGSLNQIKGSDCLKHVPRINCTKTAVDQNALIAFVTAKQVAEADLSFMKMPTARKETLKAFAQFMLEKPEADMEEWLNIKGVGPWTVNYVTMRNSDSPDVFLATDLVVKNQLKQLADGQVSVQPDLAAPWRSYLTLSLWNLSQSNVTHLTNPLHKVKRKCSMNKDLKKNSQLEDLQKHDLKMLEPQTNYPQFAHLYKSIVKTPHGFLSIFANENAVKAIDFSDTHPLVNENKISKLAAKQLSEYIANQREYFDLPLDPDGTDFQKHVWQALLDIPFGATASYLDIAIAVGNKKACRAVGAANGKNPIPIVIPCHRIIGTNGKLTGYAGGLTRKTYLLALESKASSLQQKDDIENFSLN